MAALRWAAAAFVETEKNFRRIMGCQQLWMLNATLDEPQEVATTNQPVAQQKKTG